MDLIQSINAHIWGYPLIILLIGTGLFLTFRLVFIQIRYLSFGFRIALGFADKEDERTRDGDEPEKQGDLSYFQALATALSATIGIGNIVGVAGAILMGGPGALFWMWMTALVGMATKYAEAVLAVRYRVLTDKGYAGGPMYYIEKGLGWRWMGVLFAVFALIAAPGIGNLVQINAAAGALANAEIAIPREVTALVVALIIGLVILGGVKRIGRVAGFLVPFMALFYIGGCLFIIIKFYHLVPKALDLIFTYAFKPLPAIAGGAAGLLLITIQKGVGRGLFSNEAGLGSAPIAAASAKTDFPVKQGLVSMLGPFIDTLVICSLTGLVVIIGLEAYGGKMIAGILKSTDLEISSLAVKFKSALHRSGEGGIWSAMAAVFNVQAGQMQDVLTATIFSQAMGIWGRYLVSFGLFFFSISTILGWYFYSDRALIYLGAKKFISAYRLLWVLLVVVGGIIEKNTLIWAGAEIFNAFMAFPNLIALLMLSGVVAFETKRFFKKYPHRHDLAIQFYLFLLRLLPKNKLSKLLGWLAGLHLPRFFMIPVLLAFARIYRINVSEAELELKNYPSLNKFFTRALKNGARIVEPSAHVIVSPVDGTVLKFGDLSDGTVMQSKGIESSLQDLLGSKTYYKKFIGGKYATVYLSPKDYHRIHSPCAGRIQGYYYQPGKLFPVNEIAVETINRLFSRNERLITYIETKFGLVAMVKVGATTVGKIKVTYDDDVTTNRWFRIPKEHFYKEDIYIQKGEEIGRFEMGSTVMLLFERDCADLLDLEEKQRLVYGQPIGIFTNENGDPIAKSKDEVDEE